MLVELDGAQGNVVIVGAPQSGKSTLLRSLVCSLALTHTPREVQVFCLDFGGGALDAGGGGNWRTLLERFAEDHAPAYLRRDAATSTALRSLAGRGVALGVFTDAPEPLARVALAQLGATRRVAVLESGADSLDRVVATLGPGTIVVRTRSDLLSRP